MAVSEQVRLAGLNNALSSARFLLECSGLTRVVPRVNNARPFWDGRFFDRRF